MFVGRIPELLIGLVIVLLIFGPGKLPGLGRGLGEMIKGFRHETATTKAEEEAAAQEAARKV